VSASDLLVGAILAFAAVGCAASQASDIPTVEIEPSPAGGGDVSAWSSRCPRGTEALPHPNRSPTADQLATARNELRMGVSFLQDFGDKYEEAFPFFVSAYELSRSLNALQNAALCADKLELHGFAIDAYERVIAGKEAQLDPDLRQELSTALARIRQVTAVVVLSTSAPHARLVDTRLPRRGNPIVHTYELQADCDKRLRVHSGNHELVASAEGFAEQRWRVELQRGTVVEHLFELE